MKNYLKISIILMMGFILSGLAFSAEGYSKDVAYGQSYVYRGVRIYSMRLTPTLSPFIAGRPLMIYVFPSRNVSVSVAGRRFGGYVDEKNVMAQKNTLHITKSPGQTYTFKTSPVPSNSIQPVRGGLFKATLVTPLRSTRY